MTPATRKRKRQASETACRARSTRRRGTNSTVQPFIYTRLDKDKQDIRVLELLPGKVSDTIRGTLRLACLNSDPEYDAASYVWGDPTPTAQVIIDGGYLRIAENLAKLLVAIRHKTKPRTVWIDAICINQDDVQERGHQVQLMRNIYSQARTVRVWLDVDVNLTHPSFHAAKRLSPPPSGFDMAQLFPGGANTVSARLRRTVLLEHHPLSFWDPLFRVFSNPYWERVWTQQEFFLARDLVFHFPRGVCGPEPLLRFDAAVCRALTDLTKVRSPENNKIRDRALGQVNSFITPLYPNRHLGFSWAKGHGRPCYTSDPTLLNLYLGSADLKARDARDHVFGVLGLVPDGLQHSVRVDYTLDVCQVYRMVTDHFILATKTVNFLCYMHVQEPCNPLKAPLPSWSPSPDKRSIPLRRWVVKPGASAHVNHSSEQGQIYDAGVLRVRGIRFDTLKAASAPALISRPIRDFRSQVEAVYHSAGISPQNLSNNAIWYDPNLLMSIFFHLARGENYKKKFRKDKPTLQQLGRDILDLLSISTLPGLAEHTLSQLAEKPVASEAWLTEDRLRISYVLRYSIHRGIFVSTDNKRIGLTHPCNQRVLPRPGDEVWVIFGCAAPLILRRNVDTGRYKLIGPVCIAGIMSGEAVQGIKPDGTPEEGYDGPSPMSIELE